MIQQVTESEVLLIGIFQTRNEVTRLVVQAEFAVIVALHHATERASSLRHRCKSIERVHRHGDARIEVNLAVGTVTHHLAMTHYHHLATGERTLIHAIVTNRVNFRQQVRLEAHLGWNGVTQAFSLVVKARTGLQFRTFSRLYSHGQHTSGIVAAEYGLRQVILSGERTLISHHRRIHIAVGKQRAHLVEAFGLTHHCHHHITAMAGNILGILDLHLARLVKRDNHTVVLMSLQFRYQIGWRVGTAQIKGCRLGITCATALEHRFRAILVTHRHYSNAPIFQIVQWQQALLVAHHSDGASTQPAHEHLSGIRVHIGHYIRHIHLLWTIQAQRILETKHFLATLVNHALAQFALGNGLLDGSKFTWHFVRHEQHIVASQQCIHAHRTVYLCTSHTQRISKDETFKAHLRLQQVGHMLSRHGARSFDLVNSRNIQMSREHTAQTSINETLEWYKVIEFQFAQTLVNSG